MKKIIILVCSITIIACQNKSKSNNTKTTPSTCIQQVIAIDDSLGNIRNHACEKISLSQTIKNYSNALSKIDFSGCPTDFSESFHNHIRAWDDIIDVTNNHAHLRGEMHDLFDQIKESKDSTLFNSKVKSIWDTWADIEKNMQ